MCVVKLLFAYQRYGAQTVRGTNPGLPTQSVRPFLALKLLPVLIALLPTSVLAAPGDQNWDDRFCPLGMTEGPGNINAMAVSGSDLYVGGTFTVAGGSNILNVAHWDGRSWSPLGTGISNTANPYVYSVAVNGTDVYVGGAF